MNHSREGMLVLPLIARPCAWQLEPDLAELQARPADGRPLSTGSDAQIDLDLTAFAYELASRLQLSSTQLMAASAETAERFQGPPVSSNTSAADELPPKTDKGPALLPCLNAPLPLSWTGTYFPSRRMQLTILAASQDRVQGKITYLNDRTVTRIDGRISGDRRHIASDSIWAKIPNADLDQVECAIEFRETGCERREAKNVDFNGKYFGLVMNQTMVGVWVKDDAVIGDFALELDKPSNSA
jgi:hypothetical protein